MVDFLVAATNLTSFDQFVLKLDDNGDVSWAQRFESNQISASPMGLVVENSIGQLYGYNSAMITEMDTNINVCDMVPYNGVTSQIASFDIQGVTLTSQTDRSDGAVNDVFSKNK